MRARTTLKILAIVLAAFVACVTGAGVVLYAVVGQADENQPGMLANLVSRALSTPATEVHIGAVDGALSSDATIRDITIADKNGIWLRLDHVRLVWRRTALLMRRLEIDKLEIGTLQIDRKPLPADQPVKDADQPILPDLPVKVQIKAFALQALALGKPILGEALTASATGDTELGSPSEGLTFHLDATRTDSPGHFMAALAFVPKGNALSLSVKLDEPAHGLLSKVGHLPDEPPVHFALDGNGTLDGFRGALSFQAGPTIDANGAVTLDRADAGRNLALRLGGHLGPMLPGVIAPIFSGETDLDQTARIGDDGSVALQTLALTSHLARLDAHGTFAADKTMDFAATIRALPSHDDVTEAGGAAIKKLVFDGRVTGPATAPTVTATLSMGGAHLPSGDLGTLDATLNATPKSALTDLGATVAFDADVKATGIAPHDPALAAAIGGSAGLTLRGTSDLRGQGRIEALKAGTPTMSAGFSGDFAPNRLHGHADASLPDLARFRDLAGKALAGSAQVALDLDGDPGQGRFDAKLTGGADKLATGLAAADGLLGPKPTFAADLGAAGDGSYMIRSVGLDGAHLTVRAGGTVAPGAGDLSATIDLPDLAAADPRLTGTGHAEAHLTGGLDHPDLTLSAALDKATAMKRPIPHLGLAAIVHDLRGGLVTAVKLDGTVDTKPARGLIEAARGPGGAGWDLKTLDVAVGSVTLKGAASVDAQNLARGTIGFAAGSLADLSALALSDLRGSASLDASFDATNAQQSVHLSGKGADIRAAGATLQTFGLRFDAHDLTGHPVLDADAKLAGAVVGGQAIAAAELTAKGSPAQSTIGLTAKAAGFDLDAAGALVPGDRTRFDLARFSARRGGRSIALQGPASFTLDNGAVLIQHLALGLGGGRLAVEGRAGKTLDLKAVASAVPLSEAEVFAPGLGLGGTLDASASISGPAAAPTGPYRIAIHHLTGSQTRSAGLPPIEVTADGQLEGNKASLKALVAAGAAGCITASGTLPLDPAGALALEAKGKLEASVANATLGPSGRTVSGTVLIDAHVSGPAKKPVIGGLATLSGGTFRDSLLGTRFEAIEARIAAQGDHITVERLSATTPNGGTVSGSGQVSLAPDTGFPGTIAIRGQNATLMDSSLATIEANLAIDVAGALARNPKIGGRVDLTRVDVGIPDRLPTTLKPIDGITHVNASGQAARRVAALSKAQRAKALKGTKGRAALFDALLDVIVSAPNHIFVHGRGVTAELGGQLHVSGTTDKPIPKGAFSLYSGKISALGKTLTFTKGNLTFSGDLVPELDFAAQIQASDVTAQIAITGPAAAPVFAFTSNPELPQDEILSRVLFNKASGSLSTAQALQLAETAAQFSDGGDGAFERMRKSLGVDSLDIGAGPGGPSVGVSRAIGDRLSVGVRTGASPDQTGVSANVDVTRHIRVESDVNSNGSTAVGLGTQFEW